MGWLLLWGAAALEQGAAAEGGRLHATKPPAVNARERRIRTAPGRSSPADGTNGIRWDQAGPIGIDRKREGKQMALFSHVIKQDAYFFVAGESGDAPGGPNSAFGLYLGDTRVLSRYAVSASPGAMHTTSASFRAGDRGRVVLLADEASSLEDPARQVVIERRPVIAGGMFERISAANCGDEPAELQLWIEIDADFRDMFEVRGMTRKARGRLEDPEVEKGLVRFRYRGLDQLDYVTEVHFSPAPAAVEAAGAADGDNRGLRAVFPINLEPKARWELDVSVRASIGGRAVEPSPPPPRGGGPGRSPADYDEALRASRDAELDWIQGAARWRTDNAAVNETLEQSLRDVRMLLNDFGGGPMPSAGVPWYAAPFGRDSLIASIQLLSVRPDVAAGALRTLARWQGTRRDPTLDEEPGKILHELRSGEMARMREIPFTPYYGSVDATALFLIAAGEYWRWTADRALVEELMPALERAARWLDQAAGPDGYIAYHRTEAGGLANQGWKDSGDAIVHKDGRLAEPPIALAEAQAYAYGARLHYAALLEAMGEREAAADQRRKAKSLKAAFNRDFWVEETQFYAMALDGRGSPVASVGSNPGHGLWTGVIPPERAGAVARILMGDDMFSGYGVRTLSASERGYHPLSYHRGTVWPHDNSLIAMGLARSGQSPAAARIAAGLFAAASFDRLRRLPELFGGHAADLEGPVWYPVACIPQAWAAGTPFLLLQAVLGLEADAPGRRLALAPRLPEGIDRVTVENLLVGGSRVRIEAERKGSGPEADFHVEVLSGEALTVEAAGPAQPS